MVDFGLPFGDFGAGDGLVALAFAAHAHDGHAGAHCVLLGERDVFGDVALVAVEGLGAGLAQAWD